MYLDTVKAKVKELKLINTSLCRPCTTSEIDRLEVWIHGSLPEAYKEFLRWGGHDDAGLFQGSERFYRYLIPMQEWAVDLLKENAFPEPLPPDTFVFFMHQGYQFAFFARPKETTRPCITILRGNRLLSE